MTKLSAKLSSSRTIWQINSSHQIFQPSANKPVKALISNKYNSWFSKQVAQIALRTEPSSVKVSAKFSDIKPLHTQWIVDLYNHVREEKGMIINGFKSAGVNEAIQSAK